MHDGPDRRQRRLWLLAGTGEGPRLAAALLAAGWRLSVSVVGRDAGRPYPLQPGFQLQVGPLAGEAAMAAQLEAAHAAGAPFTWVVDATHPFASRVTADLAAVCRRRGQPLLRLRRPLLVPPPGLDLTLLSDLDALAGLDLRGERLLFAIGARQLARAVALSPGALPFARLLPHPTALRRGRAAGLPEAHLACQRPGEPAELGSGALERALLRQWGITTVLCRQSGGSTERGWQGLCASLGLRLLLLARPQEPEELTSLELPALIRRLDAGELSPDGRRPAPAGTPGSAAPAG